ncbi:hypothetical protein VPHD239_0098 [Vibrio phage D239]
MGRSLIPKTRAFIHEPSEDRRQPQAVKSFLPFSRLF